MSRTIYEQSLHYHAQHPKGKLEITATKPLTNPHDLALAYSPGVAEPCVEIARDPLKAAEYTIRGNLVAVITNGTAVLGLGNIGPLAAKPVMEGKAVLFKKFAGIDAFDIEINETDPQKLVDIIASLEPTFGGINLEDIKAPECFDVERELSKRVNIPVLHDDQHGTAIIVNAAIKNALELAGKSITCIKMVASGAGASATACIELLIKLGLKRENLIVLDRDGVIFKERQNLDPAKEVLAADTSFRTLKEALKGADVFLGLSSAGVMTAEMAKSMAPNPIIFALANPEPEIRPEVVHSVRSDAIIATGRTDYPNQVNNALCFPYIFRGALDVGATCINHEMKVACVDAIARIAKAESNDLVAAAYGGETLTFGRDYIIPKPFDRRLYVELSYAVARAAVDCGIATRPITDWDAYYTKLKEAVYRSGMVMRPIFAAAKAFGDDIRLVFSEGEDERVLQAIQTIRDEKIAKVLIIGRPDVIERRIKHLGLRLQINVDFEVINPQEDSRYKTYWQGYHEIMARKGITPDNAKEIMRTNTTVIAAMMLHLGDADAMICGCNGSYPDHLVHIMEILGIANNQQRCAALSAIAIDNPKIERGILFITDPYVNIEPTAQQLAEITIMAAEQVQLFGIKPKAALLSYSNFGAGVHPQAKKMRQAMAIIRSHSPDLEIEGECHADAALDEKIRAHIFPGNTLKGAANLLIMPNIDAANIALNTIKVLANGQTIGPILMGIKESAHICTPSARPRTLVNLAAIAVSKARLLKTQKGQS
jgi:malate dehydrogenase (oxaloacetate-decarboxylating)(NADP+)